MTVGSPLIFWVAFFSAITCAAIARRRRFVAILLGFAVFAAFAASADVRMLVGRPPVVAVLIDASPSTRGFWFRDTDQSRRAADQITASLAPGASLQFFTFADGDPSPMTDMIAEQAVYRTTLVHMDADAYLMLSDGHANVSLSVHGPIYPVITRDAPTGDARLHAAASEGDRVLVSVANDGPPRTLTWPDGTTSTAPRGNIRLSHPAPAVRGQIHLDPGDRWPENDVVDVAPAVQIASERWWIGDSPAPAGYRSIAPAALPPANAWLAARQVVLDNVPADALDATAMRAISHYVRDLGGALTIVGGDRAFSAGGYGGTDLDALSPLASRPPDPQREWLVLIDASGSMAANTNDGRPRLDAAIDAASTLVAALPTSDPVGVASFARELRIWPARDDRRIVAPSGLVADGPTNLALALKSILLTRHPGSDALPLRVIALTDGDADMSGFSPNLAGLARSDAAMTIDWVRLDNDRTHRTLADVATASGGSFINAGAPLRWRTAIINAMRVAERVDAAATSTPIAWRGSLAEATDKRVEHANATWPRRDVEVLAARTTAGDAVPSPIAARWRVGEGQVIALAFAAPASVAQQAADLIASSPRDPRFTVTWEGQHVTVDAAEAGAPLNDLSIEVRDLDAIGPMLKLNQIAPGRYATMLADDPNGRTMAMRLDGRTIDLHVVTGSSVEEFREVGVDRDALEGLAARTGGRPIDRDRPEGSPIVARRERPTAVPLLLASLAATAAAVVVGRR